MTSTWINIVVLLIFIGLVFVSNMWVWPKAGLRAVADWCAANSIAIEVETFDFNMGRPPEATVVGKQEGMRYMFKFTLHSSLLGLLKTPLQGWDTVVLRDRVLVD